MAPAVPRRARGRAQPRALRPKHTVSYAEIDSETEGDDIEETSEEEEEEDDDDDDIAPRRTRSSRPRRVVPVAVAIVNPPRRSQKRRGRTTRTSRKASADSQSHKTKKRKRASTPKSVTTSNDFIIPNNGVILPWANLPYHVLITIFTYASFPLYEGEKFHPCEGSRWLVNVARVCRAFSEPALTVLYTSPPLLPMASAHELTDLVKMDPSSLRYKYRSKIETLQINVGEVVAHVLPRSGYLDLYGLIRNLPRLADLEFYHEADMEPYRTLETNIKWHYPESIFDALSYVDPNADPSEGDKTGVTRLRSWRWSSRLAGKKFPIERLPEVHLHPSFASLKKIVFVNYQTVIPKGEEEDPKHEVILGKALHALPSLEHLSFESCTLINKKLFPLLPTRLRNFELINCWDVTAAELGEFLLTHGQQMRCLTLNYNQSLSLEFLPTLATACPNLEVLRMDLKYYNLHNSYRDSDPQYNQLLTADQVPTWPSKLQVLDFNLLRKWEYPAAEVFFQSLLDSAGSLPDLRRLRLDVSLDIPWRDRAGFREKWVGSFNRVFKRVFTPPIYNPSIRKLLPGAQDVEDRDMKDVAVKEGKDVNPGERFDVDKSASAFQNMKIGKRSSTKPPEEPQRKSTRSTRSSGASVSTPAVLEPEPIPIDDDTSDSSLSEPEVPPPKRIKKSTTKKSKPQSQAQQQSPPPRRSTRSSVRNTQTGIYAEPSSSSSSSDESESENENQEEGEGDFEPENEKSYRRKPTRSRLQLEIAGLIENGKNFSLPSSPPSDIDSDSNSSSDNGKMRKEEVIQGMCDEVIIAIANLRPMENQFMEADFLDEERSGDEDWNENAVEEEVGGYAW